MSVIILQNQVVHYEVLGHGKPLVFIHGWIGSWRYWIPAMQAASMSFRTYACDLWGFGDTAKIANNYSLEHQVNLVDNFLQQMGIGKIALIGHGLGAVVAALFAYRNPTWVDRLMLVSLPNSDRSINPRLHTAHTEDIIDWLLVRSTDHDSVRNEAPKTDPKAIRYSLVNLQAVDLPSLSHQLDPPCLMVYGQNDPVVEIEPDLDLKNGFPKSVHKIIFEQSGHFPMLDEMSKFNRLLADFLALSSGFSPRLLQLKEEWKRRVR
jgi:pimeloyl-ACP methyl ester carboxylesterase